MNAKYLKSLERLINVAQTRVEHHTKNATSVRERLIQDFSREDGPGWSSDSSVFNHIMHSAKAQAYTDLNRLLCHVLNGTMTHESAVADLNNAIALAKGRLREAKEELVEALKAGITPADQIGWSAHQARIDVLEDFHGTLKANTPEDFNE